MAQLSVPVIAFVAHSGTGKTTLLTQIVPQLKQHGLRVGVVKHTHHIIELDKPGKDSFRLRAAGADTVMLVSKQHRIIMTDFTQPEAGQLNAQLKLFEALDVDLILLEGFKYASVAKIELHRAILQQPLLYPEDPDIIAIATDTPLTLSVTLPVLDLNQPAQITRFILNFTQLNSP